MKIGLDMDDVLCDLTAGLMELYERSTGKSVKYEEIDNYLWFDARLVERFHEEHNIENFKPIEMAIESVNSLLDAKDKLHIITDRDVKFMEKLDAWIKHHLKTDKIKVTYTQGVKKSIICKEKGIGLILEDSGKNALDCAGEGIKLLLFDKPWNRNYSHPNITRVNSWKEALQNIIDFRDKL